jgi:hypothetical protein
MLLDSPMHSTPVIVSLYYERSRALLDAGVCRTLYL